VKDAIESLLETLFLSGATETFILHTGDDREYSIPLERAIRSIAAGETMLAEAGGHLRLESIAPDLVQSGINQITRDVLVQEVGTD
jgi:hypothetical protein